MLGGNTTITLSAATTLLLTTPATGTVSASAGPNQSQNNVIKFVGTMAGQVNVQLTLPRTYTFDTTGLTMGTSAVVVRAVSGATELVCLPPGEISHVVFDGLACRFFGLGRVGSFMDLAVATTPLWISGCTNPPYLPCDGAVYNVSSFPALGAILGSTFGGNGITTFGVPDAISRAMIPIDLSGSKGRVTNAISGVDGATIGAVGGDQRLQSHNHTLTDPGHVHNIKGAQPGSDNIQVTISGVTGSRTQQDASAIQTSTTGISIAAVGSGSSQNMIPVIVFGCRFIKT